MKYNKLSDYLLGTRELYSIQIERTLLLRNKRKVYLPRVSHSQ